jgi:hypothetical protein
MTTNTRKTPAETDAKTTETAAPAEAPAEETVAVAGPPLRPGQKPEKLTLAHHLRIGAKEYLPGSTVVVSPDYARQLRRNGYAARG